LGVVVVILLVILLVKPKGDSNMMGDADNNSDTALEATEDVSEGSVNAPAAGGQAVTMSYQKALETYKDRRIQFNDACAATPNTVTYKDNTGIMLDNRSAQSRTIKVGTTYTVKGYGFKIVTLPDIYLKSSTLLVDCDKQQNVATVLVQE
jgi:hypothetical protein